VSDAKRCTELLDQLEWTEDDRLMLGPVPMVLLPRWFFVGIMRRVVRDAGSDVAARVYADAGFEGAYNWARVQLAAGLSGRAVMEQYLGSMTCRGWGRFEIETFDPETGRGVFRFHNSALALEMGETGQPVCLWTSGAMAGGVQAILDSEGIDIRVRGKEVECRSAGAHCCRIVVEPR
jgi:predicted hydrocarbon binding protein